MILGLCGSWALYSPRATPRQVGKHPPRCAALQADQYRQPLYLRILRGNITRDVGLHRR